METKEITDSIMDITHHEESEGFADAGNLGEVQQNLKKGINKAMSKKVILIVLGVLLGFGVIYGVLALVTKGSNGEVIRPLGDTGITNPFAAKYINPLTGEPAQKEVDQRPLAVMVNNHIDARPQSGLIYADIVYEIVAEGGITRFLPFFLSETPEKIGPVRSTREYYLVLVKELGDAMLMHIGWSPQALEAIQSWPVRSLGRGGGTFWRDNPRGVATEHTAYVSGVDLREVGTTLGWDGTREIDPWSFKEEFTNFEDASPINHISIDFWYEGDYSAIFDYDGPTNTYKRSMGYDINGAPIPHNDQDTGEQIFAKNLIVQFVDETPIPGDDKNRLEYDLVGSGTGLVFLDGKIVEVTWSKVGRDTRTMFYDTDGNDMKFNRGKFWISVVPSRNSEQVVFN